MANTNTIPLKDYCLQFMKAHNIKVDIDELLKHIYEKARSLAHNANCIGVDNSEVDQWIIDAPQEIAKKKKAEKEKTAKAKTETPKAEKTAKKQWKMNKPVKEVEEDIEEETEEESVFEQLDLF